MPLVTVGAPLEPSAPLPPVEPTFTLARVRPTPPLVVVTGNQWHLKIGDTLEVARMLIMLMRRAGELVYTEKAFWHYNPAYGIYVQRTEADIARLVHGFTGATMGALPSPEETAKAEAALLRWQNRSLEAEASGQEPPPRPKMPKPRLLPLNAPFVTSVLTSMANELEDPDFFESAHPGIVFRNGFVEVRPDAIYTLPHSPDHRARFAFGFDYQPEATSTRFHTFCDEIWRDEDPHEVELRRQLYLAFIGTCNLGLATRFGKAIVQYGEGANGKTTLMHIVEGCMPGPETITNVKPQAMAGEYYRDMLAGKLLNSVEELPEAYIEDTGPLKAAITGDYMLGRAIRKAPRRFRPIAGHLYNANNLPKAGDHTTGFWRRLILVDFKRDFELTGVHTAPKEGAKPDISAYVLEEVPGILCEALSAAWHALRANHYPTPTATAEILDEWRADNDVVREFIETCLEVLDVDAPRDFWMRSSDLYFTYNAWSRQNGHTPLASNKFRGRLKQLKLRKQRRSDGIAYAARLKNPTYAQVN